MKVSMAIIFVVLLFAIIGGEVSAHEGHNTNKPARNATAESNANVEALPAATAHDPRGGVSEFPTLHPLIVHFPIVLIILAAILQIVSFTVFRNELSWLVIAFTLFGSVTAWLSSNTFHPHTTGLTENSQRLLLEHELYASLTFWFAVAGLAAKSASKLILKSRWWSELAATLLLAAAAGAVAITGHHGAELVHKEGVGPRGDFLEAHDH